MENLQAMEFEKMEIMEQMAEFGKIFNLKLFKKDFEEIKNYNLFTLLTDETLQATIKNEKIKKMILSIKQIATIFSYTQAKTKEKISNAKDVAEFLKTVLKATDEQMIALFLNAQNKIMKYEIVSKGTPSRSAIYPAKIARIALLENARAVIIAHNHPGGTLKPSQNDILATDATRKALKTLDIQLLDHIIIANNDYYSFQENNLL